MRKTTNLVLAAGLAASAFATTAAAQQQAAACDAGEFTLVTKKAPYEAEDTGPPPGFYSGHDIVTGAKGDLTVSISWESNYDWDLAVFENGETEVASAAGDQTGGDEPVETVEIPKVKECTHYEIRVRNFIGVPLDSIQVSAVLD